MSTNFHPDEDVTVSTNETHIAQWLEIRNPFNGDYVIIFLNPHTDLKNKIIRALTAEEE